MWSCLTRVQMSGCDPRELHVVSRVATRVLRLCGQPGVGGHWHPVRISATKIIRRNPHPPVRGTSVRTRWDPDSGTLVRSTSTSTATSHTKGHPAPRHRSQCHESRAFSEDLAPLCFGYPAPRSAADRRCSFQDSPQSVSVYHKAEPQLGHEGQRVDEWRWRTPD